MHDDLASFLRSYKDALGLSAEQIAQQLNQRNAPTHPNAVRRWLTGETRPAAERFDTLLEVLAVVKEDEIREAYRLRWPQAAAVLENSAPNAAVDA